MCDTAEPYHKKARVEPSTAFAESLDSVADNYLRAELKAFYPSYVRPADPPAAAAGDGVEEMKKRLEIFICDRIGPAPSVTYMRYDEIMDAFRQSQGCENAPRLSLRWTVWTHMGHFHPWCRCEKQGFHCARLLPQPRYPLAAL